MKNGFTLLEVIISIFIISIIVTLSFISLNKFTKKKDDLGVVKEVSYVFYETNKKDYLEDINENGNVFIKFGELIDKGFINEDLINEEFINKIKNSNEYNDLSDKIVLNKQNVRDLYVRLYYDYNQENKLVLNYSFPANLIIFPKIRLDKKTEPKQCYSFDVYSSDSDVYKFNVSLINDMNIDEGTSSLNLLGVDNDNNIIINKQVNFNTDIAINKSANYKLLYKYEINGNKYEKIREIGNIYISNGTSTLEVVDNKIKANCKNDNCKVTDVLDNLEISLDSNEFTPKLGTNQYKIEDKCSFSLYESTVEEKQIENVEKTQITTIKNSPLDILYIFSDKFILYKTLEDDTNVLKIYNPNNSTIKNVGVISYRAKRPTNIIIKKDDNDDDNYNIYIKYSWCNAYLANTTKCYGYAISLKKYIYNSVTHDVKEDKYYENKFRATSSSQNSTCKYSYSFEDKSDSKDFLKINDTTQIRRQSFWNLSGCVTFNKEDVLDHFLSLAPKKYNELNNIINVSESIYKNDSQINIEVMSDYFEKCSKLFSNCYSLSVNDPYLNLREKKLKSDDDTYLLLVNAKEIGYSSYYYYFVKVKNVTTKEINLEKIELE